MLFLVNMTVQIPHNVEAEKITRLTTLEHERASELERQGKWLHAWRVVGKWANVSIFEVDSPTELHEILNSLPLYPFMEIAVSALCPMRPAPQEEEK
jgi:muconolactone D-isomerase